MIKGNTLPNITWRWLGVNDVEVPQVESKAISYTLENSNNVKIGDKPKVDFGISSELVEFNQTYANLELGYVIEGSENEMIEHHLGLDKDNAQLVDNINIEVKENSKGSILVDYYNIDDTAGIRNSVFKVYAHENSEITVYLIQRHNIETVSLQSVYVNALKNANVKIVEVEVGGKYNYINIKSELMGKYADVDINMIYFGEKKQQLDYSYIAKQYAKETNSVLTLNGALKDQCKKIFRGTIDFQRGCSQSKGEEQEYVTLLSDECRSIAIPTLLCKEDDVEGIHAASVGRIEEDILFYIMSRGFDYIQAHKLIIESKFAGVLDQIPITKLKEEVWESIESKIE